MAVDPVTAGIDLVKTVTDKIWPDAGESERNKIALIMSAAQQQVDVNKNEATSSSVFVAGWRPFIGWTCGAAVAYTFLAYPLLQWAAAVWNPTMQIPVLINMDVLWELMLGLLGLGGLRTFEKIKGVAR